MSTLLTPIITQLELDRDRFKDLVNGDETVTVSLEGRTEKSITGQVIDRIDLVAADFSSARDSVEGIEQNIILIEQNIISLEGQTQNLRNDASSFATTSEGARDQSLAYYTDISDWRDTIESQYLQVGTWHANVQSQAATVSSDKDQVEIWKNQTEGWRNEAQTFRDNTAASVVEAADLLSEIEDAASGVTSLSQEPLGASPSMLYPTQNTLIDVTVDFVLVSTSPRPILSSGRFVGREVTIQRFDNTVTAWTDVVNQTVEEFDYTVTANTLDSSDPLRWKVEDVFESLDASSAYRYTTRNNDWRTILTSDPADGGSYPSFEVIGSPVFDTVTANSDLSIDVVLSGFTASASSTHQISTIILQEDDTGLCVFSSTKSQNFDGTEDLSAFNIPKDKVKADKEYTIRAVFGGTDNDSFSEWSSTSVTSFSSYYDDSDVRKKNDHLSDIENSTALDYTSSTTMYSVDRTTDPTITITPPPADKTVKVGLYIEGATGTVTFPSTDVVFEDGNSSPALGTSFTLMEFVSVGTTWVLHTIAKD